MKPVGSETFTSTQLIDVKIGPGGKIFADFALNDYQDSDGRAYVNSGRLARLTTSGKLDSTYGIGGSVLFPRDDGDRGQGIGSFVVLDDGAVFISEQAFENSYLNRISADGKTISSVANGYLGLVPVRDAQNRVYAVDNHFDGYLPLQAHRFLASGEDDPTFAVNQIEVGLVLERR